MKNNSQPGLVVAIGERPDGKEGNGNLEAMSSARNVDTVPLDTLAMPDDQEQMQPPEVGDEVNYQVTGKVVAIEGEVAKVQRTSINGQEVQDNDVEENQDAENADAAESQGLRNQAGGMGMMSILLFFAIMLSAHAQSSSVVVSPEGAIYRGADPVYSLPFFSFTVSAGQTYYVSQPDGDTIYSDTNSGSDALTGTGLFTPQNVRVYEVTTNRSAGQSVTNKLFTVENYYGNFFGNFGTNQFVPASFIAGTISFNDVGGVADGVKLVDVSSTNGSPKIYSDSAAFTKNDLGKSVCLYSDITNISFVKATIIAVNSAQSVTLSANATANFTNTGIMVYGTDNTTAFANLLASLNPASFHTVKLGRGRYVFASDYTHNLFNLPQASPVTGAEGKILFQGNSDLTWSWNPHKQRTGNIGTELYFFGTPSSASPTNAIFADNAPAYYGITTYRFDRIQFSHPVAQPYNVFWAKAGGLLQFSRCSFLPEVSTNTDVFSIGQLYLPNDYSTETNGFAAIVGPAPGNNGGVEISECNIVLYSKAVSCSEHSTIYGTWFWYCGTGLLLGQFGISSAVFGDANYFWNCRNDVALANDASGNPQPIHLTRCGVEDTSSGTKTFDIYDPNNHFTGWFGYYGKNSLTNFTSSGLAIEHDVTTGNGTTLFVPYLSSSNASGLTNLLFANLSTANPTWAVPNSVTMQNASGYWHLKAGLGADFSSDLTVNSTATNARVRLVYGSQIAAMQIRTTTPTITDLNSAKSGMLWCSNGVWWATTSVDGSTVATKQLAP